MNPRSFATPGRIAGDFNGDGTVSAADYFAPLKGLSGSNTFTGGTWTAIGVVVWVHGGGRR